MTSVASNYLTGKSRTLSGNQPAEKRPYKRYMKRKKAPDPPAVPASTARSQPSGFNRRPKSTPTEFTKELLDSLVPLNSLFPDPPRITQEKYDEACGCAFADSTYRRNMANSTANGSVLSSSSNSFSANSPNYSSSGASGESVYVNYPNTNYSDNQASGSSVYANSPNANYSDISASSSSVFADSPNLDHRNSPVSRMSANSPIYLNHSPLDQSGLGNSPNPGQADTLTANSPAFGGSPNSDHLDSFAQFGSTFGDSPGRNCSPDLGSVNSAAMESGQTDRCNNSVATGSTSVSCIKGFLRCYFTS